MLDGNRNRWARAVGDRYNGGSHLHQVVGGWVVRDRVSFTFFAKIIIGTNRALGEGYNQTRI